jgi:hypothetical protein
LYKSMCEDDGSLSSLGQLPNVAFDVITAVYGASILPIIASVQPIDEERGMIYFKNLRSRHTKGSQIAGQTIVSPNTLSQTPYDYASNAMKNEIGATHDGTSAQVSFTLSMAPIRSESLTVTAGMLSGKDVGPQAGNLTGSVWGNGFSGDVNYSTGVVTLKFSTLPPAGTQILVNYQQNYELSPEIPAIDTFFDSKSVNAQVYALKGSIGMMQSFAMSKRFGLTAEDELSRDLVQEINREIGGDLIRRLRLAAPNRSTPTVWSRTAPAGVSYFEHKQTYKDYLAKAETAMIGAAGRGTISVLIVGRSHASVIQTLPGFEKLYDGNTLGAHVFGRLDGMTIVRVLESSILGDEEGIAIWRGASPFESSAIYAPFMPLTVTGTIPNAPNPLQNVKAAAVWAAVDVAVPAFVTMFNTAP